MENNSLCVLVYGLFGVTGNYGQNSIIRIMMNITKLRIVTLMDVSTMVHEELWLYATGKNNQEYFLQTSWA